MYQTCGVGFLHCMLASCSAVYCTVYCLWARLQWAGGRCQNLTTASARSVCVSLSAFFINLSGQILTIQGLHERTEYVPQLWNWEKDL